MAKSRGAKKTQLRRKAKQQVRHARQRVSERHETAAGPAYILQLAEKIKNQKKGHVQFVERQSLRVTKWFVWDGKQWLPVVYDRLRHTIATVLPVGAFGAVPPDPTE